MLRDAGLLRARKAGRTIVHELDTGALRAAATGLDDAAARRERQLQQLAQSALSEPAPRR